MNSKTVFLVDDNPSFLSSAKWLLNCLGYTVIEYADPTEVLGSLVKDGAVGDACFLLDIRMQSMSGLDLHDKLKSKGCKQPVIYMTGHGDVSLAVAAMEKGAVTFLEKPFSEDSLQRALSKAFSQECSVAPNQSTPDEAAVKWRQRFSRLTPREKQVLDWIVQDKLNKTISDLMGISIKTVQFHRSSVMHKLGANSITQLIKMVVTERVL